MVKIKFIEHSGQEHDVECVQLRSLRHDRGSQHMACRVLMRADCGGACSCATCHVYVDQEWLERTGEINPTEEAMLSISTDRKENSRLSCQIQVTEDLDGLVVNMPEFQF